MVVFDGSGLFRCSVQWVRSYLELVFASSERIYRQSSLNHTKFGDSVDYFRPCLAVCSFSMKSWWTHKISCAFFSRGTT